MTIGTLDRSPPSLFNQGPSALSQAIFFAALAVFLMVADARLRLAEPLRAVIATVLLPVQQSLAKPVEALRVANDYRAGVADARTREQDALARLVVQSEAAMQAQTLAEENQRLRSLLDLRPRIELRSMATEILYEAPDPFSRKVIIDRGTTHGVVRGAPVINERGVLGQVTRTYPLTSEVTLLTDRDAAIPILNSRTHQRGAAFGDPLSAAGGGGMELRFMASNADVQAGDELQTSGVDGIYPPGLPVARVVQVDRRADSSFAKVMLTPIAVTDAVRVALVIEPLGLQMPERPRHEPIAPRRVLPLESAAPAAASEPSAAFEPTTREGPPVVGGPSTPPQAASDGVPAEPLPALPPQPPETPSGPAAAQVPAVGTPGLNPAAPPVLDFTTLPR